MRSLCLSLASSILLPLIYASSEFPLDCAFDNTTKYCQEPLGAVTTIVPDSLYIANLPCPGCGAKDRESGGYIYDENDLYFNISLSHDHNRLLLNDVPIWPSLPVSPHPPRVFAEQIPSDFSRTNLGYTIECLRQRPNDEIYCVVPSIGSIALDYDYAAKLLATGARGWEKWEITFDALGDLAMDFNSREQKMLRVVVQGLKTRTYKEGTKPGTTQPGSSLFETPEPVLEWTYNLEIASVEFVERSYTFPTPVQRTLWGKVAFFFAGDVVGKDGHVIYLDADWDAYGQYGTLKNEVGKIVNDWPWDVIAIVIGSVFGSALVLYGVYRLYLLAMVQRELARWDGMDTVWERLRREDDAGNGLLEEEGYRDYDDDETLTGSSYRDEVVASKPLPPKPLPEKPLPTVPLIDA